MGNNHRVKGLESGIHLLLSHHDDETRETRCLHFSILGKRIYVCARCLAMVTGLAAFLVVASIHRDFLIWLTTETATASAIAFLGCLPMTVDGGLQLLNVRESGSALRLATGFSFGFCVLIFSVLGAQLKLILAMAVLLSLVFVAFKGETVRTMLLRTAKRAVKHAR